MSKNQIFTSPLGIGIGIGIGTALGAMVIGAIGFTIFKYSKSEFNNDEDDYNNNNKIGGNTKKRKRKNKFRTLKKV